MKKTRKYIIEVPERHRQIEWTHQKALLTVADSEIERWLNK